MAKRVQVAFDCEDPERLARFWAEALGYRVADPPSGAATWEAFSADAGGVPGERWCRAVDPDGVGPPLLFHRVPEAKIVKNRVHLDVVVAPGADKEVSRPLVDAEVVRLLALGATYVRTDHDETDYYR